MRTDSFGDLRAENDQEMLDRAFFETPEYLSLLEERKRRVVVGRRGAGKSALFYRLQKHWQSANKTHIVVLTPSETEVIGLRLFPGLFGSKYSYLKAACCLAWQYAMLQETLLELSTHYKVRADPHFARVEAAVRDWRRNGDTITSRLTAALRDRVDASVPAETRVAALAQGLRLSELLSLTQHVADVSKLSLHIVADRLDEGYEPDSSGIAIVTGLVYAFDKLSSGISNMASTVFIRDNIFRALQSQDPDYSRNIEGDVLRLHWDEYRLLNMICNRIRTVKGITQENNLKVWDTVASRDLRGTEGFRRCLRLTLYRPRDLLMLVNRAMSRAQSHKRTCFIGEDVDASAREISCSRLDDLKKEYAGIVPGLDRIVEAFAGGTTEIKAESVSEAIKPLVLREDIGPAEAQTLAILRSPEDIVHALFSIGFLGIWSAAASSFVFSHDGKSPDFNVDSTSALLIHPCYWIALNLRGTAVDPEGAEEIHDEYDIEVSSETPEIRKRRLGQLISRLQSISPGDTGAVDFEEWCWEAVRIVFATGIVNVVLHPNMNATQRRDVVGRNTAGTETWRRILDDYRSRQVVFEVKNRTSEIEPSEYRQMLSYLAGEHGRLGFIINRSESAELRKESELAWVREIYHEHDRRVIVKLPAKLIISWLSKLRSPQKHNAPDKGLGALLDTYERMYLRLGGTAPKGPSQ